MFGKLEQCPFCDSKNISPAEILGINPNGKYFTQTACLDCGAVGPEIIHDNNDFESLVKATQDSVDAWNRRPE